MDQTVWWQPSCWWCLNSSLGVYEPWTIASRFWHGTSKKPAWTWPATSTIVSQKQLDWNILQTRTAICWSMNTGRTLEIKTAKVQICYVEHARSMFLWNRFWHTHTCSDLFTDMIHCVLNIYRYIHIIYIYARLRDYTPVTASEVCFGMAPCDRSSAMQSLRIREIWMPNVHDQHNSSLRPLVPRLMVSCAPKEVGGITQTHVYMIIYIPVYVHVYIYIYIFVYRYKCQSQYA